MYAKDPPSNGACRSISRPTFADLVAMEPKLGQLLREARRIRDTGEDEVFCANAIWFGWHGGPGFKPRLSRLVGWYSGQAGILATAMSYDVAFEAIYNALPVCRGNCSCL